VSFLLTFFCSPTTHGISISHENFGIPQSHLICVSVFSDFSDFFVLMVLMVLMVVVHFQVAPFKAVTWLADFTKIFNNGTQKL
jgi:hypothetical protein